MRRLRDVVARIGLDALAELFALLGGAVRADQHAVAARFAHGLDDVFIQMRQHVLALGGLGAAGKFRRCRESDLRPGNTG